MPPTSTEDEMARSEFPFADPVPERGAHWVTPSWSPERHRVEVDTAVCVDGMPQPRPTRR
jgi:hypothetical protein